MDPPPVSMSDSLLRKSFNSRLSSVMETLLRAAAFEITRIFESSISDYRLEIARSRNEADTLKRRLDAAEKQMREIGEAATTRRRTSRIFEPSGKAKTEAAEPGTDSGIKGGKPVVPEDSLVQVEGSIDALKQSHRVKDEVTALETSRFGQMGPDVISIVIKEELVEPDSGAQLVDVRRPGGSSPVAQSFRGPRPGDGPQTEGRWARSQPVQHPPISLRLSAPGMGCVPCGPSPVMEDFGLLGSNGLGCNRRMQACSEATPDPSKVVPEGANTALSQFQSPTLPVSGVSRAGGPDDGTETREKVAVQRRPQRPPLLNTAGERPYSCALCMKGFISPSHLNMHMRVHTGERPYCCGQCGMRFAQKGNLRAHQRQVHQGRRPFPCPECGKRFTKRGNLRTHQQQVHLGKRPFPCPQCGKGYFSQRDLRVHQRLHGGD